MLCISTWPHTQVMSEIQLATDARLLEAQLNHCSEEINQLCDSLMTQELQLVDQLEVCVCLSVCC